jgi:hypothetical protein
MGFSLRQHSTELFLVFYCCRFAPTVEHQDKKYRAAAGEKADRVTRVKQG